ncbi:MAG: hypothetical protein M5U34_27850 [Chloroflexi bacterium]|nr:hypothetical protein [Chloroflexota bacterium]
MVEDFHLMFSPYAPAGASVVNEAAYARWRQFEAARPLCQEIDQKLAEQALIAPMGCQAALASGTGRNVDSVAARNQCL